MKFAVFARHRKCAESFATYKRDASSPGLAQCSVRHPSGRQMLSTSCQRSPDRMIWPPSSGNAYLRCATCSFSRRDDSQNGSPCSHACKPNLRLSNSSAVGGPPVLLPLAILRFEPSSTIGSSRLSGSSRNQPITRLHRHWLRGPAS